MSKEREKALREAVARAAFVCPFNSPAYEHIAEALMLTGGFDIEVAKREAHR